MLTHTGKKPFSCQYCSYSSITMSNVRVHLRLVHKKENLSDEEEKAAQILVDIRNHSC